MKVAPTGHPAFHATTGVLLHNYCFCLDLNYHFRGDQAFHFDHAGGWPDLAKELAMSFADLLPVVDVSDIDARADNVFQAGACPLERGFDVLEDLNCLRVGVSYADDLAVSFRGGCAGYVDGVSYANGTRVAHDGFPGGASRDVLTLHGIC
jgi:hypothetical protein